VCFLRNLQIQYNIRSGCYIKLCLSVCVPHPLWRENSGNFKEVSGEIVALIFYSIICRRERDSCKARHIPGRVLGHMLDVDASADDPAAPPPPPPAAAEAAPGKPSGKFKRAQEPYNTRAASS
jgi:hypothetical protein